MWENTQRTNGQANLDESKDRLKEQLELEKQKNVELERQLILLKQKKPLSSPERIFEQSGLIAPQLAAKNKQPIVLWEADFSEAGVFIEKLNRKGITDLRHYFKSNPDELAGLLKKIKHVPLTHASKKITLGKQACQLLDCYQSEFSKPLINFFYVIQQRRKSLNSEVSFKAPDGNTQIQIIQFSVIEGFEHDYSRVMVAIVNCTDNRMTEFKLQETNHQLTNLIGNLKGIVYRCQFDQSWTMLFTSDSIGEMTGYTRDELLNNKQISYAELIHPDDLERVTQTIQTAVASDQRFAVEYRIRTKSGEEKWFWEQGIGIKNALGKIETLEGYILDITGQKNARIRLDNERLHLRTVIETIPDLIWLKDPKGVYLNCNYQFGQLLGATEAEIVGKTEYDFVDRQLADSFRKNDLAAMQANQPVSNLEAVTFASDGHQAFLEIIKTPMRNSNGKLIGVLGIARDVTENKRNEQKLEESKNWYQAIFNNTGTATCIINEDSEIVLMNDMFVQLTSYNETDLANKVKWVEFIAPDDLIRMQQFHRERRETGKNPPKQYEFTLISKSGKQHHILLNIDLIPGTSMSVASLLDISLRVQAQKELKQSQEKYQRMVENINDVIYEVDGNWTIAYISPSVEAVTGYPAEYYIGKHFMKVVVREDQAIVQQEHENLLQTKTISPFIFRIKTKDKNLVWIRISARPVFHDGQLIGLRGVAVNVTKQKAIEAELIQAKEEAEQANYLKSAFLATMSHELRTPLNAIIGFSQLMDHTIPKKEMIDMAQIIFNSGNHLLSIIESILSLTMLQSRQAKLRTEIFYLIDLQKTLRFYLEAELNKHGKPELSCQFQRLSDSREIELATDKTKLTQLLTNLLGNAVKYSEKGIIDFSYQLANQDIIFCIKDEGIGIPPEKQDIIFEHFRQVDDTSTRKYSGVGLGLAICKEIAELMNGQIWMESDYGKGSSFYFRLPGVVKGIGD